MGIHTSTFAQAVEEFAASLSNSDKSALIKIGTINPLVFAGRFVGMAMRDFDLKEGGNEALLLDVARVHPHTLFNMDFLATSADPMIAATLIVEGAQKILRGAARTAE
jgi:hypothetical protein